MIRPHSLFRLNGTVRYLSKEDKKIKRGFSQVDLAAKERQTRTVLLRLMYKFEGIARRASAATKNSDDEFGIEGRQLLQGLWSIERRLEE